MTAQDNIVAGQCQNRVGAAIGISNCLYTAESDRLISKMCLSGRIDGRRRNLAGVTEDQIVAAASTNRISKATTEDNVITVASVNDVYTTYIHNGCCGISIGNLDRCCSRADNRINVVRLSYCAFAQSHIIVIINVAGIAQHDITTVINYLTLVINIRNQTCRNEVTFVATQDDVVASQGHNRVHAAIGVLDGLYLTQGNWLVVKVQLSDLAINSRRCNPTRVTEDQVVTVARLNVIAKAAADNNVVSISGINEVGAATDVGRKTDNRIDISGIGKVGITQRLIVIVSNVACVTQDDIVIGCIIQSAEVARRNGIAFVTAYDNVSSDAGIDGVTSTDVEGNGFDPANRQWLVTPPWSIGYC